MRIPLICLALVLFTAAAAAARAGEVDAAVGKLVAADAASRQVAYEQAQAALATELRALLTVENPEAIDRVAAILERNTGVIAFLQDVLQRAPEQRAAALDWLGRDNHVALVVGTYASSGDLRVETAKKFPATPGAHYDLLLCKLIGDPYTPVAQAAVQSARQREPSTQLIAALWTRAFGHQFDPTPRVHRPSGKPVKFRGRDLQPGYDNSYGYYGSDPAAAEVLVDLNSPLVEQKLAATLTELTKSQKDAMRLRAILQNAGQPLLLLVQAYQPRSVLPALMRLVEEVDSSHQEYAINGQKYVGNNRTLPMVMVLCITGQKPADYGLRKMPQYPSGYWGAKTKEEHSQAEAKLKAWYRDYLKTSTTQPATAPAGTP